MKTARRKICVATGSRAEYGLLYHLIKKIKDDPKLILQVVVTGMHLSPEFGLTYRKIEKDGFCIDEKVEMLLSSDSPVGISKSVGLATIGFADAFERLKPDILVILGDRFEIFAAAQAALFARIPIAHLHGGETTEGAIDEFIRHAITKMSHFHFVAAEPYKQIVIQLGEQPANVMNVGAIGIDNIVQLDLLERKEFEKSIGFPLGKVNFIATYHPETLAQKDPEEGIDALLGALDHFRDAKVIITKPNADVGGRIIIKRIEAFAKKNHHRVHLSTSLGRLKYLSALQYVDVVIGNSSSGIIEAPFLKTATVNIGDRQKGRLRATSVIDCSEDTESIIKSIKRAMSDVFRSSLTNTISLYGYGDASNKIKKRLKEVKLDNCMIKNFWVLKNCQFQKKTDLA